MTPERQTQIKDAAIEAYDFKPHHFKQNYIATSAYREAFRKGAKWADLHPINKPVAQMTELKKDLVEAICVGPMASIPDRFNIVLEKYFGEA